MTRDLIPNGGDIPVTNDNRIAYVQAYVEYVLDVSVTEQFEAFQRGFRKVCGGDIYVLYIYIYVILHIYLWDSYPSPPIHYPYPSIYIPDHVNIRPYL
jgi:hypothetical protein